MRQHFFSSLRRFSCVLFLLIAINFSYAQRPRAASPAAAPKRASQNRTAQAGAEEPRLDLHAGWALQSACTDKSTGDQISSPNFKAKGWIPTTVPSTVLAAQVAANIYRQPYYDVNLKSIPGYNQSKEIFSHIDMPEGSPYKCAWWYRTQFTVPATFKNKVAALHFDGINYRANVWINGKQVANDNDIAGAYRVYEFDVSKYLKPGARNVLAVQVSAPTPKDLAINWVDWNPAPPDKDMGLWRDVWLSASGSVQVRWPAVMSKVDPSLKSADLTITADVRNASSNPVKGTLTAQVEDIRISQPVELGAGETKTIALTPDAFPQLKVQNPKLWWPYQMGTPNLHTLHVAFKTGANISDQQNIRFGIRQVTAEMTDKGARLFRINGKKLLIRGGGWSPDMMLREDRKRIDQHFQYVRDLNLNTIRLEGKMETNYFYDIADRYGIFIMAGWCCCDIWEQWKDWQPETHKIAVASLKSQLLRLRSHPSSLMWLNGSDNPPTADVEQEYLNAEKEISWPNPIVSSATQAPTTVTGASGVKMTGPYDYVPPAYWYTDTKFGGAYGFNTETSAGAAPPPVQSLKKFLPAEHIWPIGDDHWNFHAGLEGFPNINNFRDAMNARYGTPAQLEDFEKRAQAMTYENQRAMYEAYSRNKYTTTGVIQWMQNNAWPSLIWHLYDYYMMPAGGYFGTKKACEPLHIQYSYDDGSVYVVNSSYQPANGLTASVRVLNMDLKEQFSRDATLDAAEDSSNNVMTIPALTGLSPTFFVRLDLKDSSGKNVSSNFYWLSTKKNEYDYEKTDYKRTPVTQHEDLTALANLPAARVAHSVRQRPDGATEVTLKNSGDQLAFLVHVRLVDPKTGDDVLPVMWSDNYVTLLPGESRTLDAHFSEGTRSAGGKVLVDGWNLQP